MGEAKAVAVAMAVGWAAAMAAVMAMARVVDSNPFRPSQPPMCTKDTRCTPPRCATRLHSSNRRPRFALPHTPSLPGVIRLVVVAET